LWNVTSNNPHDVMNSQVCLNLSKETKVDFISSWQILLIIGLNFIQAFVIAALVTYIILSKKCCNPCHQKSDNSDQPQNDFEFVENDMYGIIKNEMRY